MAMKIGYRLVASAALALWANPTYAEPISPTDAAGHVGETATVCGVVASTKFAANSRSQPTFIDLGQPYPNAPFKAVIFGSDRQKFESPELSFRGKRVCVTGQIQDYRGKPEIILNDPRQLTK
jgi:DNA/RNA endonuclease YhcR with UshA esterase domain